ncbi:Gfo/Idh/MocA family protein [Sporobolomyces salmoneus]|uniref:Gfo/Idh/MocA family protein n=1 Tax=Sporobolomyces salmoneus TaxID=183962 RepID=UPI00317EB0A3
MPVSICVVGGAGLIGRRHVQHCLDEESVELACIVDPTQSGVEFAKDKNVLLFRTLDELLIARAEGHVRVDGVILATPNSTHVPLATQLLKAGITTLVEKPLSTDVSSGKVLLEVERSSQAKILVGHHRRFNPYVRNMKRLLDSGLVGEILAVQGQWSACKPLSYFQAPTEWRQDPSAGGGPILINLVHDIDLFRYFFGNITRVYCEIGKKTRGFEVEETGAMTLRFVSGIVGAFVFSDASASPGHFESATGENPLMPQLGEPVYSVLGTTGSFSFPELKVFHYSSPSGSWLDRLVTESSLSVDTTPPFTHQLRHFVKVIGREEQPNCCAEDALLTIHTLDAIVESAKTGLPVEIPVAIQ